MTHDPLTPDVHLTADSITSVGLLAGLLRHLPMGVLVYGTDLRLQQCNAGARRILHLDGEDLQDWTLDDICSTCLLVNPTHIRATLTQKASHSEQVQDVLITYLPIEEGGKVVGGAVVFQPRPGQPAPSPLQAEGMADVLFEASPDCLKLVDLQGRLTQMNVHGMSSMEIEDFAPLQGQQWTSLWPDETRPMVEASIRDARSGKVGRFQGFCPTARGTPKWWDVVVLPVYDSHQQLTHLVASSRDITEGMKLQHQSRALLEEQKRFIADAAHELRTPLTAIQGNLDLLFRYPHIEESEKVQILSEARQEAFRLSRLVQDMLQLARGDQEPHIAEDPLDWSEVVQQAFGSLHRLIETHQLVLHPMEPVMVLGDRDRLKQLTLILLENAIKYTGPGGTIQVSLQQDAEHATLRVADTGMGIAPEDLERVFERFYRADRSRQRSDDPGGTGLGLPIARWIVEQHGGHIWLESEPGKGTTALVKLPVQE